MLPIAHLVAFIFYLPTAYSAPSVATKYDHTAYLDGSETFQLHWSVDKVNKVIKMAAVAKSTGWIGFGISKGLTGRMMGADIVIGWVDSKGEGFLVDHHGIGNRVPVKDKKQDYRLKRSEEREGSTTLEFERDFFTCDDNDMKVQEGTVKVIWAYSADNIDPKEDDVSSYAYHKSARGSRSINLLGYVNNSPPPSDAAYFDILQRNYSVPAKETTYHCIAFKIPDVKEKNHIIEITPLIQKGNEGIVHHMLVYECASNFPEHLLNVSGECYTNVMPADISDCIGAASAYAWAIGGGNFKFPAHTGMPIGEPENIKYVVLETHYNNPQLIKGMTDRSGLRFYHTKKTRTYDAATLLVGQKVKTSHVIPPKAQNWVTTSHCPSTVTEIKTLMQSSFPNNAIKIFGAQPHSHYAGRGMWLKHIAADGTELPEIYRDDNYDFDFQQSKILAKEIDFKPGEALTTNCKYNTMSRDKATVGGLSSYQEMCMFFILYYPRQKNFLSCESEFREVKHAFNLKYSKRLPSGRYTWEGVAWNNSMIQELKQILNSDSVEVRVRATGGRTFTSGQFNITRVKTPRIDKEMEYSCRGASVASSLVLILVVLIKVVLDVIQD